MKGVDGSIDIILIVLCVCFLVERPEHHQPELCDSAGLQPDSAGPEFSHGGGNSAD